MITKDNLAYTSLFEKLNTILKLDGSPDKEKIGDIGDYFLLLEQIKEIAYGKDGDPSFLILPIDEEMFAIDANSRSIKIPNSFAKNGIGVKGDELAEIVYFSIDRYFDLMDLFSKDLEILIQWELPNGDKGLSATINKTCNFIENKVVFGWPISREITKEAGNIKFSVRFYSLATGEDGKNYFSYSFGTLTSTVKINPAQDFTFKDVEEGGDFVEKIIDKKNQYLNLLKNSEVDNTGSDAAYPKFVDLQPDQKGEYNDDITLEGRACFDADAVKDRVAGQISYKWQYKEENESDIEAVDLDYGKLDYRKIGSDEVKNEYDIYWIQSDKSESPQYIPYTALTWPTENRPEIFKLYAQLEPKKAGRYRLAARNYAGRKTGSATSYSDWWKIAYAQLPIINLDKNYYSLENDGATVLIDLSSKITSPDSGVLNYQWYKDNEKIAEATGASYTANEEGIYYIKVTNTKNQSTAEKDSANIFVYYLPSKPEITGHKVNGEIKDSLAGPFENVETLAVEVSPGNHSDEIKYQWYKIENDILKQLEGANQQTYKPTVGGRYQVQVTNVYKEKESAPISSSQFVVIDVINNQ